MEDINARMSKAFDIATDAAKQLLTLSTAIFGVVVTFGKDIVPIATSWPRHLLTAGWLAMLVSMLCGALVLMNCAGQLGSPKIEKPTIYHAGIRMMAMLQVGLFVAALVCVVLASQSALK